MATKRFKDIVVYYRTDFGRTVIGRQRVYKVEEDASIQTPVTRMLTGVQIPDVPNKEVQSFLDLASEATKIIGGNLKARHLVCCLPNPYNSQGFSEFRAIIPHPPGSWYHCAHAKEILTAPHVQSAQYYGEEWTTLGGLKSLQRWWSKWPT